MNKGKTELLLSAGSVSEVERLYQAGADAVAIGHSQYALRQPGSFELEDLRETTKMAHILNRKVYVVINALLHHDALSNLEEYIATLHQIGVDAIVYGDPAVLMIARSAAPGMKLHWNTETTSTNYQTVNYWAKRGASRAILARELPLQDVLEIKNKTAIEVQAQIHGMTCIFHSKRELVSNFMQHQGKEMEQVLHEPDSLMYVKEDSRTDERYPIFEDVHGTHIMSAEDICMLGYIGNFVNAGIDSVKIETILKPIDYSVAVTQIYRQAIDQCLENPNAPIDGGLLDEIQRIQPEKRPLGTGFYFKEQIY